ncbi:LPS assembly lipoprotein LptE [Polynucleobacter sp.]|jgi:LPS-assembly lipoprotein|uniref:LPS-assembly lipoprotein LptE n=1 Tax=Polynucleobacter sp. TaxID=2029855 RepID=UPI0025875E4A|nr:LPS assembly lipoprotein LptE [Polynucleobacter sp.]MCX7238488.1 LPS assembly lipoprotein LptE [Polynucleobacter sp.]
MSVNSLRRTMLGLIAAAPLSGLIACGYRLRGMVDLPFKVIAITGSPSPPLRADLQTAILTGTDAKVALNPKDADLILEITNDVNGREILAYNSNGQVSAYRLNIRVGFRAFDMAGAEVVPEAEIYMTRDMDFSVSTVLATDVQIQQFLSLMRRDLAIQILRRVAATAKSPRARAF